MTEPTIQKFCAKCNTLHSITEFTKDKSRPTGYFLDCKTYINRRRYPDVVEPDLPNEQWKPVVGYASYYAVSNLGRVKRVKANNGGRAGALLKCGKGSHGYPVASVCGDRFTVHSLMMAAFVGPCPKGYNINHKDGVKSNNVLDNLEYVTPKENTRHARRLGLMKSGDAHHYTKITTEDAVQVRNLISQGISQAKIARMYKVHQATISNIHTRSNRWAV